MKLPEQLTSYRAPSSSWNSSRSVTYDWSGLDDHIKKQDQIGALRDAKFVALYGGDVAGSVSVGGRIRDLLKSVRLNAPDATERDPVQIASPLRRVSSSSSSSSGSVDGEQFAGVTPREDSFAPPPARGVSKELDGAQVLGVNRDAEMDRLRRNAIPGDRQTAQV